MVDVIKELEGFCTEDNLNVIRNLPTLNQATEVETYRNLEALRISINKFIYDRGMILKDINYLYSDPDIDDTDFVVVNLNGVYRSFNFAERVSIVKVFERRQY